VLGIESILRKRWIEIAWGAFTIVNVAVMYFLTTGVTVPFHFIWVSMTLVYGLRLWRLRTTLVVLGVVMVISGAALLHWAVHFSDGARLDEMTEVPLMGAMFLGMVWHAQRARSALAGQQRLMEREREFVRDASHELGTPITVARGHVELLQASALNPQAAEDAEIALDELSRLARISERLLILAGVEHPNFLAVSSVRVETLLARTIQRWRVAAERDWELRVLAHGWIAVDQERLELAIDSLIENAVKFTEPGDGIRITASKKGEALAIEVADSGIGIASDQLGRVFDRFARADGARARGNGGTGLGLAIVKAIVEVHGGSVGVSSVLGRGATFRIVLPGFLPAPPLPAMASMEEAEVAVSS
jgi:signal transduction histidine kinase